MKGYRKIFIFVISILFLINPVYAVVDKNWLDSKVKAFVKNKPVKAMIYGLWIDGTPVSINAVGESMTGVPATVNMHYRIGGITETMLTAALMLLVEENRIRLDDKISRWYPDLPNADLVTVKMLANCTSGYPDYVYNRKFIDEVINNPFRSWTDKDLIDYATMEKPKFKPGTSQHYSHTDFVILGSILSQVSHLSTNELLNNYIFKRVGMNNTQFNLNAMMPHPVLHAFSQDRGIYEESTYWNPSWTSNSGAVVSNITDIGKWAHAWMRKGLLTEKSIQILRAPDTVGKGKNTNDFYFAMGFVNVNHWLIQNPSFGGYSGVFGVLPEKNMVFIAVNTLNESRPDDTNYSVELLRDLAMDLAPDYPIPVSR
ncbi:D-alanyl-D-alanine carboxypeptidase [Aquicella siphonis]|uniref:D-alanyl-D-alanine carboxypeptidase n=1 Tax=Aquicella siphonis TaxID=254247 RepID=A0A5E4PFX2_9COXI|nr:serine hydrolase domain-containing protein [Aquicella siphonis]VVC75432.1 D-alanyl-D-alanine carboxypeptidase [Aquicella siphonis]